MCPNDHKIDFMAGNRNHNHPSQISFALLHLVLYIFHIAEEEIFFFIRNLDAELNCFSST